MDTGYDYWNMAEIVWLVSMLAVRCLIWRFRPAPFDVLPRRLRGNWFLMLVLVGWALSTGWLFEGGPRE